MNPEEQIKKRLENAMRQLRLELAAQGVDVNAITLAFTVTWQGGAVAVVPVVANKSRSRLENGTLRARSVGNPVLQSKDEAADA